MLNLCSSKKQSCVAAASAPHSHKPRANRERHCSVCAVAVAEVDVYSTLSAEAPRWQWPYPIHQPLSDSTNAFPAVDLLVRTELPKLSSKSSAQACKWQQSAQAALDCPGEAATVLRSLPAAAGSGISQIDATPMATAIETLLGQLPVQLSPVCLADILSAAFSSSKALAKACLNSPGLHKAVNDLAFSLPPPSAPWHTPHENLLGLSPFLVSGFWESQLQLIQTTAPLPPIGSEEANATAARLSMHARAEPPLPAGALELLTASANAAAPSMSAAAVADSICACADISATPTVTRRRLPLLHLPIQAGLVAAFAVTAHRLNALRFGVVCRKLADLGWEVSSGTVATKLIIAIDQRAQQLDAVSLLEVAELAAQPPFCMHTRLCDALVERAHVLVQGLEGGPGSSATVLAQRRLNALRMVEKLLEARAAAGAAPGARLTSLTAAALRNMVHCKPLLPAVVAAGGACKAWPEAAELVPREMLVPLVQQDAILWSPWKVTAAARAAAGLGLPWTDISSAATLLDASVIVSRSQKVNARAVRELLEAVEVSLARRALAAPPPVATTAALICNVADAAVRGSQHDTARALVSIVRLQGNANAMEDAIQQEGSGCPRGWLAAAAVVAALPFADAAATAELLLAVNRMGLYVGGQLDGALAARLRAVGHSLSDKDRRKVRRALQRPAQCLAVAAANLGLIELPEDLAAALHQQQHRHEAARGPSYASEGPRAAQNGHQAVQVHLRGSRRGRSHVQPDAASTAEELGEVTEDAWAAPSPAALDAMASLPLSQKLQYLPAVDVASVFDEVVPVTIDGDGDLQVALVAALQRTVKQMGPGEVARVTASVARLKLPLEMELRLLVLEALAGGVAGGMAPEDAARAAEALEVLGVDVKDTAAVALAARAAQVESQPKHERRLHQVKRKTPREGKGVKGKGIKGKGKKR
jgi:hypothetical protein